MTTRALQARIEELEEELEAERAVRAKVSNTLFVFNCDWCISLACHSGRGT